MVLVGGPSSVSSFHASTRPRGRRLRPPSAPRDGQSPSCGVLQVSFGGRSITALMPYPVTLGSGRWSLDPRPRVEVGSSRGAPMVTTTAVLVRRDDLLDIRERAAVAGFLAGYTGNTRVSYTTDLRLFAAWCADAGIMLLEMKRAHVEL